MYTLPVRCAARMRALRWLECANVRVCVRCVRCVRCMRCVQDELGPRRLADAAFTLVLHARHRLRRQARVIEHVPTDMCMDTCIGMCIDMCIYDLCRAPLTICLPYYN